MAVKYCISGIYKITSPSGKVYIGQSIDIKSRFKKYNKICVSIKNQTRLYHSLNKHGSENHKYEIIEECLFEQLNNRERYWQYYYDVLGKNGLNCVLTSTFEKKMVKSIISKQKVSQTLKGHKHSEKTKIKIGLIHKGKTMSEESKSKMSTAKAKTILDTQIGIFYTCKEYSKLYNINLNTLRHKLNGYTKNNTSLIYV